MEVTKVELRCPHGPRALLAKLVPGDPKKAYVDHGQLLELYCRDCTKNFRVNDPRVSRVLHRYNIMGDLVESVVERRT